MNVKLNWVTPNAEQAIVEIARVSSSRTDKSAKPEGLINYLIKHKHWSPFEHGYMSVEIETSKAIGIQLIRHRSFTFQEFCMSGDTEIYFDKPSCAKRGRRGLYKMKLSELYRKWHTNSHMKDRIGKMYLRVFNTDTKIFENSHITGVFDTGIKDVFEIELYNGKKIKCTKEHKVLTKNGFKSLEDEFGLGLTKNGTAYITNKDGVIGCNGQPLYKDKEYMTQAKADAINSGRGVQGIADDLGVAYVTVRKWLKVHGLSFTKKEVASYTPSWNKGKCGYSWGKHTPETIKKMKKSAKKGADSNLWRGGSDRSERKKIADWCASIRQLKLKEANYRCKHCGDNTSLELDHSIPVYKSMELAYDYDNIQVLCKECHREKHKLNGDFKIWRDQSPGNTLTTRWSKIKKVTYIGKEQTYDLETSHKSHNYVADGVVVHNSQRYQDVKKIGEMFEPIELRKQAEDNRQSSTELIGGMVAYDLSAEMFEVLMDIQEIYNKMLANDVARECARMILPMCTKTKIHMTGSIRSWLSFLNVRLDEHAQLEIQSLSRQIAKLMKEQFPIVASALNDFNNYNGMFM